MLPSSQWWRKMSVSGRMQSRRQAIATVHNMRSEDSLIVDYSLSSALTLRNGQSTVGGPKWTKMDLFRPKWTNILVHFGLANAKIQFGIRPFRPKWSFGPLWTILVQYTFRQYRGHSLHSESINVAMKASGKIPRELIHGRSRLQCRFWFWRID